MKGVSSGVIVCGLQYHWSTVSIFVPMMYELLSASYMLSFWCKTRPVVFGRVVFAQSVEDVVAVVSLYGRK